MAIIADFMLVYLPAPTVSLRPPLSVNAGAITKFFHGCPDNAFQVCHLYGILGLLNISFEDQGLNNCSVLDCSLWNFVLIITEIWCNSGMPTLNQICVHFIYLKTNAKSTYLCFWWIISQRNGAKLFAVGTTSSLVCCHILSLEILKFLRVFFMAFKSSF